MHPLEALVGLAVGLQVWELLAFVALAHRGVAAWELPAFAAWELQAFAAWEHLAFVA